MKKSMIIGILCVMLALIGVASGDVYEFTDSYGNTYATGQVTFDENGIINGGVIAGATNGDVNVEQSASQGDGSVSVSQSGEIQGDFGFAGTLAADGSGNSGGNFASVTGGSMSMDQETVAGQVLSDGFGSVGQSESAPPVFTASGLISDQFVEMQGGSGYAGTLVANANGASAQTEASFTSGGMDAIQGGAVGGASLVIPYYQGIFSTSIAIPDFTIEGAVAGQGAYLWGSSGSASTTVSDGNGASGQSSASFTGGGMDLIQAGGAGRVSLEEWYPVTGYEIPAPEVPGSLSLGGAIAGQSVYMGGSSGSASTTVSGGNGASGQTVASFTGLDMGGESFGGMGASQAGAVGEVSLVYPYYGSVLDLSSGGVVAGQMIDDLEGSSGSASTTVSDGNGASGRTEASFTGGPEGGEIEDLIQAGGAGGVSLALSDLYYGYTNSEPFSETLTLDGVIIGQALEDLDGTSGSASTTVSDGYGATGRTEVSFNGGEEYGDIDELFQAGGAGGVSYALSNLYFGYSNSLPSSENLTLDGVIIGQYVEEVEGISGSASTTVSDGNGASGRTEVSFTGGPEGGEIDELFQAGGAGRASYSLSNPYTGYAIPVPSSESFTFDGVMIGQYVEYMEGSSGSASTSVSDGDGASGQAVVSFTNGVLEDLIQAGAAGDVSIVAPYYTSTEPIELSMGGVVAGQELNVVEGVSGSASTTVTHQNGASAQSTASFTDGKMGTGQAAAAGDVSLLLPNYYFGDEIDVSLGVDGVIAGQDFYAKDSGSGSATTIVSDANGNSAQADTSVTNGNIYVSQVGGAGDAELGLAFTPAGSEEEQLGLSAGGIFAGQSGKMFGSSGSASTEVEVNGNSAGNTASFTEGSLDFGQLSAGITQVNLVSLSASDLSGVLALQSVESDEFSSFAAGSYSDTAGNSHVQVNATAQPPAQGSGSVGTTQFAGSIAYGDLNAAIAGQDVSMENVGSGSAGGSASDADGNSAVLNTYITSGNLEAGEGGLIPMGILAGAGDLGGVSGALTAYTDLTIAGESGGLSLDSQNPRDFTSIQSAFSNGGTLESGIGFTESDRSGDVYHSYMDSNVTIAGNPAVDTDFQLRTEDFDVHAIGSGIGWQNNDAMCEQESGPDYEYELIAVHIHVVSP